MKAIKSMFTLDRRSLALLRMAAGLLVLIDVLLRATMISDFLCDDGFLPRSLHLRHPAYEPYWFSLYMLFGSFAGQAAMLALHGLAALATGLGYRTRAATFVCWLMCISIQSRNPYILDSGDRLLAAMLFWGLFCDWGACYSLDARERGQPESYQLCSFGTAALVLQMLTMYWISVYWKIHPSWLEEGSAIYYALNLELFARPTARWLLPYPGLLRWLTAGVMVVEVLAPLLLLVNRPLARFSGVLALGSLHLGIFIFLDIGIFPLVSLGFLAAFVPWRAWQRQQPEPSPYRARPAELLPATALLLLLWWDASIIHRQVWRPAPVSAACIALKLDQYWNLFAPLPRPQDVFYVVRAQTRSGKEFDLFGVEPRPLSWKKPASISRTFYSHRHRVYGTALEGVAGDLLRVYFLEVKARRYNSEHPQDPVVWAGLYMAWEVTRLDYRWSPVTPELLAQKSFAAPTDTASAP